MPQKTHAFIATKKEKKRKKKKKRKKEKRKMRDDDEECALFHALYPVTGGAVTDAPRVTRTDEPAVLGSQCAIGPIRSHCATGPRPNGTKGPNGPYNAGGGETRFGMFLFGHWIAHARVRGPYVDITFDPHSHEVAELLGTKLAPARLASLRP